MSSTSALWYMVRPRWQIVWQALNTREKWFNGFGVITALVSLLAIISSYIILTEQPLLTDRAHQFSWLIGIDVGLLVALTAAIGWRVLRVWRRSRQKRAGAQMHIQLTAAFSILAAIPAILVAIFAVVFIQVGVQAWFGTQIRTAVTESQQIAQAYLQEHQQSIRADMLAMAGDLNRESARLLEDPSFLREYFKTQAYLRNLSEASLLSGSGDVLARAGITLSLEFTSDEVRGMLDRAKNGEVVLFIGENGDRVRALVKLDNFVDTYLFVGRFVDENVMARVMVTNKAVDAYHALESKQKKLKSTMTLIFTLVALMLLLIAVWAGLTLAERIVGPVSRLIEATERVRAGDLNARVDEEKADNEVNLLARAFNRMTDQLGTQRRDLINANRQLDTRRRFTETVLGGVNAGVMAVDAKGVIQIVNSSALKLLHHETTQLVGSKLGDICPELEKVRRVLRSKNIDNIEMPIDVQMQDTASHWIVRIVVDAITEDDRSYVITFDDLSPLIDAQRKAAWADVARRVAHEIKNPLTPIQLSAERLRKRYAKQIVDDRETFEICTDTIIRQVDDIRHMIDEFSAFARMPESQKKNENLVTLCQQVVVLFQQAHRDVQFVFDRPEQPVMMQCDRQQISQALTNLLKNAHEAVVTNMGGQVTVTLQDTNDAVIMTVADNGAGWPVELLPRVTDPYVTTKPTGSGLGLAIVAKIIEDHAGRMAFDHAVPHGAIIQLIFPKAEQNKGETKNV